MQLDKVSKAARLDASLDSVALARVVAEVRTGETRPIIGAYNRTYNRHNR